jgi:hypothetical protein
MGAGQFHDGLSTSEAPSLQQYRSLCGLSVVALLLGLLSVVALAHPAAWSIPLLAIVCGAWALRRIHQHADALMGSQLAIGGLILGLFFLSWAPTSYFADRWLIYRESRQFAEEWLTAVIQGQLSKAYQATLPVRERQPDGTALDEYYEDNPLQRAERDAYFNDGIPKQLAELHGTGRFVFDRHLGVAVDRTDILTSPRFFIYREGRADPLLHLQMEVVREADDDGVYWVLPSMSDAEEVDQTLHLRNQHRPRA